jgi:hypothetical protein
MRKQIFAFEVTLVVSALGMRRAALELLKADYGNRRTALATQPHAVIPLAAVLQVCARDLCARQTLNAIDVLMSPVAKSL